MAEPLNRIPFGEFSENLERLFERVVRDNETLLIESAEGKLVELKPVTSTKLTPTKLTSTKRGRETKTEADHAAFTASLGSWKDVDVDAFLKDNEESRRMSTRPPVDLSG